MPDATLEWKVDCLKTIQAMPQGSGFEQGKTSKQDLIWIQDLERDGYIAAMFRMGYMEIGRRADSTIPNLIYRVHILDKGRDLIAKFESPKERKKDSGEHWYKKPVGIIALSVSGGLILLLIKHFCGL